MSALYILPRLCEILEAPRDIQDYSERRHRVMEVLRNHWQLDGGLRAYKISLITVSADGLAALDTVYPKKYAHGFCFAVLCCGYTLTDFPISTRFTSLALWQSNDCPSASKETLVNMDKYFMWIHYERLRNHNKAKHNKTVCIFLGIYCTSPSAATWWANIVPVNIRERHLVTNHSIHIAITSDANHKQSAMCLLCVLCTEIST